MLRGNRKGFYEDACNLSDDEFNKILKESYKENADFDEIMSENLVDVSFEVDNILNNERIAINNITSHVYCTQCVNGEDLIKAINENKDIPEICKYCYPYNPENSVPFSTRRCYIEKGE